MWQNYQLLTSTCPISCHCHSVCRSNDRSFVNGWSHFQYFHFSLGVTHIILWYLALRRFYTSIFPKSILVFHRCAAGIPWRYTKWQSRQQINCHSSACETDSLCASRPCPPFIVFHAAHSVVCTQSSTFIHIKYFASHALREPVERHKRVWYYTKYLRAWCAPRLMWKRGRDALAALANKACCGMDIERMREVPRREKQEVWYMRRRRLIIWTDSSVLTLIIRCYCWLQCLE